MRTVGGLLLVFAGCLSPPPKPVVAHDPEPKTIATCADLCAWERSCEVEVPADCVRVCESQTARLKPEFTQTWFTCIAQIHCETTPTESIDKGMNACYGATLKVYADQDKGETAKRIIGGICERATRCGHPDQCPKVMKPVWNDVFPIARTDVIDNFVNCLSHEPCDAICKPQF